MLEYVFANLALSVGAISIEVDVWLVNETLYVSLLVLFIHLVGSIPSCLPFITLRCLPYIPRRSTLTDIAHVRSATIH